MYAPKNILVKGRGIHVVMEYSSKRERHPCSDEPVISFPQCLLGRGLESTLCMIQEKVSSINPLLTEGMCRGQSR